MSISYKCLPILLLSLCATSLSTVSAQSRGSKTEALVLELAQSSAMLAGGARYCKMDTDTIEQFISLSDAKIVLLASDDYEKVIGRLEFKNLLTAFSVKEPKYGCDTLLSNFKLAMRQVR